MRLLLLTRQERMQQLKPDLPKLVDLSSAANSLTICLFSVQHVVLDTMTS